MYENLTDDEVLAIVKPLAEHTENSWNQKDYQGFCRYLLENSSEGGCEEHFPEAEFQRQLEENYPLHGDHKISDLVTIHRNPDHVIVIWKVTLEKRPEPGLLIYGFREHDGEILIEGCSYHA